MRCVAGYVSVWAPGLFPWYKIYIPEEGVADIKFKLHEMVAEVDGNLQCGCFRSPHLLVESLASSNFLELRNSYRHPLALKHFAANESYCPGLLQLFGQKAV
jgi:hypothetical protein